MKIRITEKRKIPFLEQGRIFDVQAVSESHGETVYFIHYAGDYLGIRGSECEVVEEG